MCYERSLRPFGLPKIGVSEMTEKTHEPKGLGGWLVLPAIGLFVMPVRLSMSFNTDFWPIFREGYWEILTTPGTEAYHPLWAPLLIFEITGNAFFVIFDLVLIYFFFTKSYRFPYLFIAFAALNLLFVTSDFLLADLVPAIAAESDVDSIKEVARAAVAAVVWVPYFLLSKRVKNTFVKPVPEPSHEPAIGTSQA
jgi:hypothetical protein